MARNWDSRRQAGVAGQPEALCRREGTGPAALLRALTADRDSGPVGEDRKAEPGLGSHGVPRSVNIGRRKELTNDGVTFRAFMCSVTAGECAGQLPKNWLLSIRF